MALRKAMRSYQCMGPGPVENEMDEVLLDSPPAPHALNKRMRQYSSLSSSSSSSSEESYFDDTKDELSCRHSQRRDGSGVSCVNFRVKRRKNLVTLLVGEDRRVFKVEPQVLEHVLFQCLIEKTGAPTKEFRDCKTTFNAGEHRKAGGGTARITISLNCDAILIEHLLWLVDRNDPCLRHLNIDELMEFYD